MKRDEMAGHSISDMVGTYPVQVINAPTTGRSTRRSSRAAPLENRMKGGALLPSGEDRGIIQRPPFGVRLKDTGGYSAAEVRGVDWQDSCRTPLQTRAAHGRRPAL